VTSKSFARAANVTASTKRPPTISSGKRGVPATNLSSLSCFPLDPVDPELKQRLSLDSPHELLQTFVDPDLDIVEGDILTVSSVDYPVRAVGDWSATASMPAYKWLVVEDLKSV
jgi:hypothetical protein